MISPEVRNSAGTVSWTPAHSTFDYGTIYSAKIRLTPKTGFTLNGVAPNFFTVNGAETTYNSANSGEVSALFPATAVAVSLTPGDNKVTLAPQTVTANIAYYYTSSATSITPPTPYAHISTVPGATLYTTTTDITALTDATPVTNGTPVFVQVYQFHTGFNMILAYGEASATPTNLPPFVQVTNITGVPSTATVGTPLTLTGTIAPPAATGQTIVWSVSTLDAGTTGANVTGTTFTATSAGTATVTATVADGWAPGVDYTQNFTITVNAAPITLTINVAVKDKLYDGLNKAEILTASLSGVVSGDEVILLNGTPTFSSVNAAKDIPINFTSFSISGADAGKYTLVQPSGVTATILPVPIMVIANGGSSKYGESPGNPGLTATDTVNNEISHTLYGLYNNFYITSTTEPGSYLLKVEGALASGNYIVKEAISGIWNVFKADGAKVSGEPVISGTPTSVSIVVSAVTIPVNPGKQTVEYAISTSNTLYDWELNTLAWQFETTFTGAFPDGIYYVYARSAENKNYAAGEAQVSLPITIVNTGINDLQQVNTLQAWVQNNTLHVRGLTTGKMWRVYTISGNVIYQNIASGDAETVHNISLPGRGVYVVVSGNNAIKVSN